MKKLILSHRGRHLVREFLWDCLRNVDDGADITPFVDRAQIAALASEGQEFAKLTLSDEESFGGQSESLDIPMAEFYEETWPDNGKQPLSEFISEITTDNTGGGCLVDFIHLKSGHVVCVNDEAVTIYPSKEHFYRDGTEDAETCMAATFLSAYQPQFAVEVRTGDSWQSLNKVVSGQPESFPSINDAYANIDAHIANGQRAVECGLLSQGISEEKLRVVEVGLRCARARDGSFID